MPTFVPERQHRSFVDALGVVIHYYVWMPGKPRAAVQIAHGVGEHALRYEVLAEELVNAGYAVFANDHRGHGATGIEMTGGDLSRLGRLGPGGLRATIADLRQLSGLIRDELPGMPLVLLGHSWGSLMAQIVLNDHADDYEAVVLTGTSYRMPGFMNGGDLNKTHAHLGDTGAEWLSRDPEVSRVFQADPLTFDADILKLFGVADGLRLYGRPRRLARDLPLLIMVGADDSLSGERGAARLAQEYLRRGGLSDVELIVYDDARHEIFNELNQADVRADLLRWLGQRVLTPAG